MKKILKKVYNFSKRMIILIASAFPIKERIIAEAFLGNKNDDNISEFLKQNNHKYKVYYVQKKLNRSKIPVGKRIIKNGVLYIWLMHTSKVIVTNSRLHYGIINKRNNQKIIQFWHGIPWKKLVYDQKKISFSEQNSEEYLKRFSEDVAKWDYLWVPSKYAKEKFLSAFRYKGKLIQKMYPADEKMINLNKKSYIEKIKKQMGLDIEKYRKIILYMPTFREYKMIENGKYEYYSNFDISEFAKEHPQYMILFRGHYLIYDVDIKNVDNLRNVDDYDSIIDLYLVSDILITDYSSAVFSFSLLRKPIVSIQFDLKEYETMRGLYADAIINMNILEIQHRSELDNMNFEKLETSRPKIDYYTTKR